MSRREGLVGFLNGRWRDEVEVGAVSNKGNQAPDKNVPGIHGHEVVTFGESE